MKIAVINGSHRGRKGNTGAMVDAFLKGAIEAGDAWLTYYNEMVLLKKESSCASMCYLAGAFLCYCLSS